MSTERPFANVPNKLWIGGEWRDSSDSSTFEVLDPGTGDLIAEVASASAADATLAVEVAHAAGEKWREVAPRQRAEILRRAFEVMIERRDELATLIVLENGKAWEDAVGEVNYAAEFFRWYSEEAVRISGRLQMAPNGDKRILVFNQPVGTSILVTPWNFPAAMATRKIAPALAAGCACVLKPASDTPLTALAVAQILHDVGLPDGVVNVLPARRSGEVVGTMLRHPLARKVSFTGSTEVGSVLLKQAADQVLTASMELGGNAPLLVFESADLDVAVAGALVAKMRNGGQSCIAANRFIVHAAIKDEFAKRFSAAMSALPVGHGLDKSAKLGPMINPTAVSDMASIVGKAVDFGAKTLIGGQPIDRPGSYFPATVVVDIEPGNPILDYEIFGPVAPFITFESEAEALQLANSTPFGLASYVFTGDTGQALRIAERIEAGMVGVNRGFISDPAAPFGGVKQSGLGREGGHEGIEEFLESKYVAIDW